MGALYGFLSGVAVGTGVTLLCTLAWQGQSGGSLAAGVSPGGASLVGLDKQVRTLKMQRDLVEEKLQLREADVARLTQELSAARAGAPASVAGAATEPAAPPPVAPAGAAAPADGQAEARRTWRDLKSKLQEMAAPLRRAEAPAAEREAALTALLAALADPDPRRAAEAAGTLASVGDHLTAAEVAKVEEAFRAAPTGAATRPGLAAAVARGLAQAPRLPEFLAGLPPVEEPKIREAVLQVLDRDPSAAYRAWAVRLSATEENPDVLDELWDEDRVVAALTRDTAAPLREAVEPRLAGAAIADAQLRGRGYLAIALSGIHDPDGAGAALGRLVAAEQNPKVKALGQAMLDTVRAGEANLATLVRLWKERRRELRE